MLSLLLIKLLIKLFINKPIPDVILKSVCYLVLGRNLKQGGRNAWLPEGDGRPCLVSLGSGILDPFWASYARQVVSF